MKRYNKVLGGTLFCFLIIIITFNLLMRYISAQPPQKLYNIEINRAYAEIAADGYRTDIALDNYQYITDIQYLDSDVPAEQVSLFFADDGAAVTVRPFYQDQQLTGYVKFTLVSNAESYVRQSLLIVNLVFVLIFILIFAILLYIRRQIIGPFQEISEFPAALSKGTLTASLPESKNRYFGKFIWSLNMLKDTLDEHKRQELKLHKEKKTLILSISHDIKTPLSAIKLYVRALTGNLYKNENKRLEVLEQIGKQTDDIEKFVNEIVKASKEDFLDIQICPEEFYLTELIENLKEYYADKLSLLKTEFTIQTYDNCLLYGDLNRMVEVVQNIIENALKYGDGKTITLSFEQSEGCLLITVKNTGNTLPEQELVHIFDSFWRGSNAATQNGSGLGLYICRQILTQMKGDIYAEIKDRCMFVTIVLKIF